MWTARHIIAGAVRNCRLSSGNSLKPLEVNLFLMCLKQEMHKQERHPISSRILTPFQNVHAIFLKTLCNKKQKMSMTMFISTCCYHDFSVESPPPFFFSFQTLFLFALKILQASLVLHVNMQTVLTKHIYVNLLPLQIRGSERTLCSSN